MIKNLIFDWSGTLCDDHRMTYNCTAEVIKNFSDKSISFEEYTNEFQIPVSSFYNTYCPGIQIDQIDKHFFELYKGNLETVKLFKKIFLILDLAKSENYSLYICTTVEQSLIENAVEKLGLSEFFTEIWGSCFNKTSFLPQKIMDLHLNRDETIFIGDTPHDIETAKLSKIRSGAACYGYTESKKLTDLMPDHIFYTPDDILYELCYQIGSEYKPKPISTVGGLIFNQKNEALFVKTNKWSNKYGIPGGKVEINETMEDAFRREIKEETNLNIKDIEFICIQDCISHPEFYTDKHFLLINFKANTTNEVDVSINYESNNYIWKSLKDALELDLNQPTSFLVKKLLK